MKNKALALFLALCMVIAMLPVSVFAAQSVTAGHDLDFVQTPDGWKSELKPIGTAEPQAKKYTLTLRESGYGDTAASAYSAEKGEIIYIQADPSEGYLAYFDTHGDDLDLVYIGYNLYALTMPGHNVTIDVRYKAIAGEFLTINMVCKKSVQHNIRRSQYGAKPEESVFLYIDTEFFELLNITVTCNGQEVDLYYLGELEGEEVFEFIMPNGDVEVVVDTLDTRPSGMYLTVNEREYLAKAGENTFTEGKIYFSTNIASALDEVIIQIVPNEGYKLTDLKITGISDWDYSRYSLPYTSLGNNQYAFIMPENVITVNVTLVQMIHPVSVTVETGLGGTASVSHEKAKAGDTVTLTAIPAEGYRLARIAGVKDLTDNGDGTYTFIMPDEAVNIQVLFLRHENPFLDVNETQFFYTPVLWAVENGITSGMTADTFGPFEICNRAQVVTFLWRYVGSPEPTTTVNPFVDVPAGSFYYKPVLWAVENGITMGVDPTHFGPNMLCNRAQVVTFLWRIMEQPAPGLTEHPFTDVDAGSFYEKPVLWALENGITTGATATTFNPVGQCLRAQVVTFLHRTAQLPPPPVAYALNTRFDANQGTVTLSHSQAQAGEIITATVVPAEGWQIETVSCLSGSEVTRVSDTEYTFVMPEREETFCVTFAAVPGEPEPGPGGNIPPSEEEGTDYVLNIDTLKFHYPSCWMVDRIKEENYHEYTGTRNVLLAYGYSPCGHCDP